MLVYDSWLVLLSHIVIAGLYEVLLDAPKLIIGGVAIPNLFALNLSFSKKAEYFVIVHFLSKIFDFCDTFFIVLRKKHEQLSFLHVYHHSTIIAIWGYLLYAGFGGGAVIFGALVNSFVHVLMYTHYLLTSMGFKNPLKKSLTLVQIFQFYLCVFQAVLVASGFETVYPRHLSYLQLVYHVSMIILFSNLLWKSR